MPYFKSAGKKQKRRRAKKDPDAPKRPPSSYLLFLSFMRPYVVKEYPQYSSSEVAQHVGAMWRKLDDEKKRPFIEQAENLKEGYARQISQFQAKKARRRGPRRAPSSYFIFMASVRAQIKKDFPHYNLTQISRHIGAMWKRLTPAEKLPFEDAFRKKNTVYMEAKRKWEKETEEIVAGILDSEEDATEDEQELSSAED